jgi:glucosamine--fructose-6-phosphate aminotransferase (isomerizing)
LGRGTYFPLALEGALKLKEISYIHAEGYTAGEMKHGPIALVDPEFPTFALAPDNGLRSKLLANLQEVRTRGGPVVCLTPPGLEQDADDVWDIPSYPEPMNGFLFLTALQLFAYEMAVYLGKDVDQPRNLAKSVTVE